MLSKSSRCLLLIVFLNKSQPSPSLTPLISLISFFLCDVTTSTTLYLWLHCSFIVMYFLCLEKKKKAGQWICFQRGTQKGAFFLNSFLFEVSGQGGWEHEEHVTVNYHSEFWAENIPENWRASASVVLCWGQWMDNNNVRGLWGTDRRFTNQFLFWQSDQGERERQSERGREEKKQQYYITNTPSTCWWIWRFSPLSKKPECNNNNQHHLHLVSIGSKD